MSEDYDQIDEIFRRHEEQLENTINSKDASGDETEEKGWEKLSMKRVDKLLIDETGDEAFNYTGDEESERD